MGNDGKLLREIEAGVITEIMARGKYAQWGWGTFSSMMSALCSPVSWQHKADWLWFLGGMIIKLMMVVSNASKGRCEQWVRMKKQIKTAWEQDDSIQVSMCLEEKAAISIQVKKTSLLWPRNSIFRLFSYFPIDILVSIQVSKDGGTWILIAAFLAIQR